MAPTTATASMTDKIAVSNWLGFTISGLVGFAAAIITVTLTFADVRNNAAAASANSVRNEVDLRRHADRLRALENATAAAMEWREGVKRQLDRIEKATVK